MLDRSSDKAVVTLCYDVHVVVNKRNKRLISTGTIVLFMTLVRD